MITKENLKSFLKRIGFTEQGNIFSKTYETTNCDVKVDFAKEEISYPTNKGFTINEYQTCNLSENENFVVLACVDDLLSKGYEPKHIELEPRWKLGHEAKSGRADIWIRTFKKDNGIETDEKESLLIIECKTAGSEFNGAWKDTLEDGAQLFSYFQQEQSTKFLCLYTCDFIEGIAKNEYYLINVSDNKELLDTLKNPKTYKEAKNNKQLFSTWKETYQQDSSTRGLFEPDIAAYHIGKNKYSIDDLQEIDSESMQKKYNEFATILRQHNVSGHENAFDKLVNLFLAKVVDETSNPNELSFYWKGAAYDDFFSLQDRLQKLYKVGMAKFLGEDVTYIDNSDIERAFRLFKNDPDATKETILKYFRELKFFTNNDFAFIDVHNEHLFYQNSAVLLKIVKMLQDIKLKTKTQNQFLGDLFEGFLDQGVKQSEGQFFTPTPIVKFLISSLPLKQLIEENSEIPQVIDYACGAGHFLNEFAEQIKPFVENKKGNLHDFYSAITGIEKEYRLSKVSKVASFMYGQDEIKIIYADALSNIKEVKDNSFSVLIANPPYSVKGFLETLKESERTKFELIKEVGDITKCNSIETFFIERAAQLLKADGVAAIILPSSILSNGNIYIKCREIILKNFDIVAIAEFGSGTFGKTGTNTATLFLRRKKTDPTLSEHYRNRVETWFGGDQAKDEVFDDYPLLEKYCCHINIPINVYEQLFPISKVQNNVTTNQIYADTLPMAAESQAEYKLPSLSEYDVFKEYRQSFENDTVAKNIKKKRITTKYTETDKKNELEKHIWDAIRAIEKEKLYYFMLAESNPQQVVVVKSPADSMENKQFLGYEWSGAKGNEGIKYLGANIANDENDIARNKGIKAIRTPLFNPQNLADSEKINTIIRQNFIDGNPQIPKELAPYVSTYCLTDMLDFSQVTFDKQIKNAATKKVEIKSKYEIIPLSKVISSLETGARPTGGVSSIKDGALSLGGEHIDNSSGYLNLSTPKYVPMAFYDLKSRGKIKPNDLLMCKDGALTGKVALVRSELDNRNSMVNEHVFIIRCNNIKTQNYLFYFLFSNIGQNILKFHITGSAQGGINSTNLLNIKIPLPPLDIQKLIVEECEGIDNKYKSTRMSDNDYKKKIIDVFYQFEVIQRVEESE